MSLATSNRDGGRTNEAGHLRGVTKGFLGRVLSGLNVSQRGAGANMSVDVAIGDAIIQRSDGTYGHPAWNDAVYNQAIAAADGSNPRRDIVVMYIDYNETPSTGVANNTNGVVKITSVSGTAAGSPVDPSNATIQSAVGSGNPFIKLARVRVAAGATSISNSVIDDLRVMATAQAQGGWIYDDVNTWTYASTSSFTVAGVDVTDQFPAGARLRIMQGGSVKYFKVLSSSFSTNTTVNLLAVTGTTLANSPIDKPAYSYDYAPTGFPVPLRGESYSTSEQLTDMIWTNGKPIYKKTIAFGALPNNAGKNVAHGISTIERVMDIQTEGYEASGPYYYHFGHVNVSNIINGVSIYVDATNIVISTGTNRTGVSANITLYYTKT